MTSSTLTLPGGEGFSKELRDGDGSQGNCCQQSGNYTAARVRIYHQTSALTWGTIGARANAKPAPPSLDEHIGKGLRGLFAARGPLPEPWSRLIARLNAQEDALNERKRRPPRGFATPFQTK